MSTPTDRALEPCPFCGAAVELRWDDEHGYGGFVACSTTDCPVSPTDKHDKAATIAAWNRRAAEIDASKPAPAECSHYFPMDPRKCVRCGWDFRNGEPAHAKAVEALPIKRYTHELVGSYAHWEVRPHKDKNGVWCKYSDVWAHWLTLATQPQQLAVTDEAVRAAMNADFNGHRVDDALLIGTDWGREVLEAAITAALPHLARKETT